MSVLITDSAVPIVVEIIFSLNLCSFCYLNLKNNENYQLKTPKGDSVWCLTSVIYYHVILGMGSKVSCYNHNFPLNSKAHRRRAKQPRKDHSATELQVSIRRGRWFSLAISLSQLTRAISRPNYPPFSQPVHQQLIIIFPPVVTAVSISVIVYSLTLSEYLESYRFY